MCDIALPKDSFDGVLWGADLGLGFLGEPNPCFGLIGFGGGGGGAGASAEGSPLKGSAAGVVSATGGVSSEDDFLSRLARLAWLTIVIAWFARLTRGLAQLSRRLAVIFGAIVPRIPHIFWTRSRIRVTRAADQGDQGGQERGDR